MWCSIPEALGKALLLSPSGTPTGENRYTTPNVKTPPLDPHAIYLSPQIPISPRLEKLGRIVRCLHPSYRNKWIWLNARSCREGLHPTTSHQLKAPDFISGVTLLLIELTSITDTNRSGLVIVALAQLPVLHSSSCRSSSRLSCPDHHQTPKHTIRTSEYLLRSGDYVL